MTVALLGVYDAGSTALAADENGAPVTGPYVTPSVDVDVHYAIVKPDASGVVQQEMRWQASSLRQRVDPENSAVYMITSWRDQTLTVVDTLHKQRSIMPAPGRNLSLPGKVPPGKFEKLGTTVVAGQFCTNWRTVDDEGHPSDACYTPDGVLVQVMQRGQVMVQALSVARVAQSDAVFSVPAEFREIAPVR